MITNQRLYAGEGVRAAKSVENRCRGQRNRGEEGKNGTIVLGAL